MYLNKNYYDLLRQYSDKFKRTNNMKDECCYLELLCFDFKNRDEVMLYLEEKLYQYLKVLFENGVYTDELKSYVRCNSKYLLILIKLYLVNGKNNDLIEKMLYDIIPYDKHGKTLLMDYYIKYSMLDSGRSFYKDNHDNDLASYLANLESYFHNYKESKHIINFEISDIATRNKALLHYYLVTLDYSNLKRMLDSNIIYIGNDVRSQYKNIYNIISNASPSEKLVKQLYFKYDEDLVLEHVKKHFKSNFKSEIHSIFNSSFDLNEEFTKLQTSMNDRHPYDVNSVKKYFVEYDHIIGDVNGVETNSIVICTTINEDKIVNLYPVKSPYLFVSTNVDKAVKSLKRKYN